MKEYVLAEVNWFRGRGLWLLGLVWLAVGVGCTAEADSNAKPEKVVSAVEPEGEVETDVTNKPPADELETIVIPLDQIAGLGRKGLLALEPELHIYRDTPENIKKYSDPEVMEEALRKVKQQSLVIPIEQAMRALPIGREVKPLAGFAVRGRDRAALPGVHRVLVLGGKSNESFSVNEEVSLVFFTHRASPYVRLDFIERKGNTIKIHYMLISHGRLHVTSTLVFIPCGKLPVGEYNVQMIRSASKEKEFNQRGFPLVEAGMEDHIVCRSFRFSASGQPNEGLNAETHNHQLDLSKEYHNE